MSEFSAITINGVPVYPDTKEPITGKVFFVSSDTGSNDNQEATAEMPLATWDHAIGHCTANQGDVIFLMPGHTETITASNTLTYDVDGVSTYGLGSGADRPTITVGTDAAATITVSAASTKWRNLIVKGGLDGLNTAVTVTGADADLDYEYQDTSATVEADIVMAITGDRPNVNLRVLGFSGGDQMDQAITLDGVDNARINIDFYGKVATSVVDMVGHACTDVFVTGRTYVSGTTNGSKNVTDTITGSTWYMDIADMAAGCRYTGGSAAAVASDDISAVSAAVAVIDGFHDVPTADATTNAQIRDVVGNKTDAGVQAVAANKSLVGYVKGVLDILAGTAGVATFPAAAAPGNAVSMAEVLRDAWDALRNGTGGTEPATNKSIIDALGHTGAAFVAGGLGSAIPHCVVKADGAVLDAATDDLFVISGGPVRAKIVGLVTTVIGGAANMSLQHTTVAPAATVELNAAPVAIDNDAVGTFYRNVGATSVFTPSTGLGFALQDPVTVEETEFLLAPGTVKALGSAAQTGVIAWYMTFTPLSPDATVTAAA